jgi:hypothetical protein
MEVTQASCKIYTSHCEVEPVELIAVFHRWIQERRTGDLLIDVADYSHVELGPGVMLVAHECYYSLDQEEGRPGLKWRARRDDPKPARDALRGAVASAVRACTFLESDFPGKIAFDGTELLLGIDDRLRAPATAETFEALSGDLEELGRIAYPGEQVKVSHEGDARACFRSRVTSATPTSLASLVQRFV